MLIQRLRLMTALAALVALVAMIAFTAPAMAQDDSDEGDADTAAPSNLSAVLEKEDVLLRWTPGTNPDYVGQWILVLWEEGKKNTGFGMFTSETDRDNAYVPLSNFEAGQSYSFQIAGAVQEEGQEWIGKSGFSNIVTITIPEESDDSGDQEGNEEKEADPPPAAKPQPTNLEATTSDGQVTLTWTPGNDDTYVAQEVKRRTVGVKGWITIRIDATASEYIDEDVAVGKKYVYRVKGVWDNGKGRLSKPARVTVR